MSLGAELRSRASGRRRTRASVFNRRAGDGVPTVGRTPRSAAGRAMGGLQLNHTRCNDSPAVRATALAASTPTAGARSAMTSTSSGEPGLARGKGGELRVSARDHPGRPGTRFRKLVFEAARKSLLHMTIQESNPLVTHGDSSRQALRIVLPHRGFGAPIMRGVLRSGGGGPAEQSGASPRWPQRPPRGQNEFCRANSSRALGSASPVSAIPRRSGKPAAR